MFRSIESCAWGNYADGTGCLLSFAGFKWWTSCEFFSSSGFWNANNVWSPRNASVDGEGLHLFVRKDNVGQGERFMAGEVVALFNDDGTAAALSYGTYLVTARVKTAASWDKLDPNVAFGVFTYERERGGDTNNPGRELDLAEISHWGTKCNGIPALCVGNSQFTLQIWDALPENLHRYTIANNVNEVTLVMEWVGANQPVTFKQYDGSFTLTTLPANPNNQWTTSVAQNPFAPANGCQRFHLNLWMGNYLDNKEKGFNNPPEAPQEVVITNFQSRP
jgi:hypothetical protein